MKEEQAMKKKLALILLTLVLVLTGLMPAAIAAAKPGTAVVASGFITYIAPTELGEMVNPAGDSGRWRVANRTVGGVFSGPDIAGDFTFTYKANVAVSQAGNLHGVLTAGQYTLNVDGKTQAAVFVGWYVPGIPLYQIQISGKWTALDGGKGNGDFTASILFIPSPDGAHIAYIIPPSSPITLTGSLGN